MSGSMRLTGRRKKLFLAVFLSLPVLAISALLYWIAAGLARPSPMAGAERVGQGAGDTGGANAIGELLRGDDTRQPLTTEQPAPAETVTTEPPATRPTPEPTPEPIPEPESEDLETSEASDQFLTIPVLASVGSSAGTERNLRVWLPPSYDPSRAHPVLYVFDAQLAFADPDRPTWDVDQVADQLITLGLIEPIVIVGVPHADDDRTEAQAEARAEEYLPVPAIPGVSPQGDAFAAWFIETVPSAVAERVNVSRNAGNVAVAGAGFGAVIATVVATEHPEQIGGLLIESMPTLAGAAAGARNPWRTRLAEVDRWPTRVVLGMGGAEAGTRELDQTYTQWVAELQAILADAGVGANRLLVNIDPAATHHPDAWRARLPDALQMLFPRGR